MQPRLERPAPRIPPRVVAASGGTTVVADAVADGMRGVRPALILVFAAEGDILKPLTGILSERFGPGCRVVGCSSAGCFAFGGYRDDAVVAVGFPAASFRAEAIWLRDLRQHMARDWIMGLRRLADGFADVAAGWSRFGLLMIDGLCQREELVAATVDATLGTLPVLGGSAGDGLRFGRTRLVIDGVSYPESAVFCLVASAFAIEEVVFDHFAPASDRMVVTDALPEERVILSINDEPAAEEYARLIGVAVSALGPKVFAAHPLLMRQGGRHMVRAIQGVTAEAGLSLMSSVESGTTMTFGRAENVTGGLAARMDALGPKAMILGFDCVLRRLALEQAGLAEDVGRIYRDHRVVGFNTYGEQHGGVHVNQTFVGLAFLDEERRHAAAR